MKVNYFNNFRGKQPFIGEKNFVMEHLNPTGFSLKRKSFSLQPRTITRKWHTLNFVQVMLRYFLNFYPTNVNYFSGEAHFNSKILW